MTRLKAICDKKGFTYSDVAKITGYNYWSVQKIYRGNPLWNPPESFYTALEEHPKIEHSKITRGELINLLERLGMDSDAAATVLWRHHDRFERFANPALDYMQRVPVTREDVRRLEEAAG